MNIDTGYIKLHRELMKWEWFKDPKTLHVFLTILLNANHEDGKWQGHIVKRGQWITGRKRLSELTGISEQSIRTILSRLESTSELTIKPTNKFSIITVVNWDTYQLTKEEINQQINQPALTQLTTNKKLKTKNKTVTSFDVPAWVNADTLKDFIDMRKKTNSAMTTRAVELLIMKLEKLNEAGHDIDELLNEAIMKSWKTVYPPEAKQPRKRTCPPAYGGAV